MSIAINQRVSLHAIVKNVRVSAGEGGSSAETRTPPACIMADELDRACLTTHRIHVIGQRFRLVGTDVYDADETDDLLDQASHTLRVQEALLRKAVAKHPDLLEDMAVRRPGRLAEGGRS